MARITYRDAGVDIDAGSLFVELIKPLAKSTYKNRVSSEIGGFSGSYIFPVNKYKDPVLVASTDGVGTKLKIAFMAGKLDTVGIDLVAMNVNDIVTCGAEPLFFLDYIATSGLNPRDGVQIIKGIAKGCKEAGCVLLGGETAEMPGFYKEGEYDIAGFAVGVVEKRKMIDGSRVKPGDLVIGISSNGLHSNGYSLVRKVLLDTMGFKLSDKPSRWKHSIGEELLRPTRIYVKTILSLIKEFSINSISHITGGGLIENIPRSLPKNCSVVLDSKLWKLPKIFELVRDCGDIEMAEMFRTFNCGIGMVVVVTKVEADRVLKKLHTLGEGAMVIGEIKRKNRVKSSVVIN
ncbi:MAG: phosphoribosylformylglycinamidine cyclo-ligase [Thermodesulfobacteriota bacterium]